MMFQESRALSLIRLRSPKLITLLVCLVWPALTQADYYWWPNTGPVIKSPELPSAEAACVAAVAITWYRGEKALTGTKMLPSGSAAECHVKLKPCKTCAWIIPNPPHWINGSQTYAVREGTPCTNGKAYDVNTGECFADAGGSAGSPPPQFSCPEGSVGNPIYLGSGNKLQEEIYFQGQGKFPLYFALTYNSQDGAWRHTYSMRLRFTSDNITLVFADGRTSRFTKSVDTTALVESELGRLEKVDGAWSYHSLQNEHFFFNEKGRLVRWLNASGDEISLTYAVPFYVRYVSDGKTLKAIHQNITVTNAIEKLTFTEVDGLRVSNLVSGGFGASFTWHSTRGQLLKVSRFFGGGSPTQAREYHYEDIGSSRRLTGITDERGIRYATWRYDDQGRAISSEHAGGAERVLINYNADGSSTVTNELGKKTTYRFAEFDGVKRITAIEGEPSANCPNSNSTFNYDERGLLKTKTDNKGHLTTYDYNERGLEVSRTEAAGTPQARTVTTDWHPTLFSPVTVTEPSRITTYTYDDQGRQLSQSVTQR